MSNRTRLFVNELVEEYHLGTPQKIYAQRWKYYVMIICASLLFVLWVYTILAYLRAILIHTHTIAEWPLALIWSIITLVPAALCLMVAKHSNYIVYECIDGFIVLRGRKREVELVLTWDEIAWCWQESKYMGPRLGTFHFYYISYKRGEPEKKTYRVLSEELWERCHFEVDNRMSQRIVETHRQRRKRK
jgi:hypothetical protein